MSIGDSGSPCCWSPWRWRCWWHRSGCVPRRPRTISRFRRGCRCCTRRRTWVSSRSTSTTTRSLDEFEYGDQSDWIDFEPGGARVTITADRAGFNYAVFDAVYPAPAGNDYYLVITDALVLGGVFDRSPIPDGGARVRIVQGSVALPAVNVDATGQNVSFATQLTYARSSEYEVVPAGTYDLEVTLADTGEAP